jgi:7-cyano-7-deazaguanine synthase
MTNVGITVLASGGLDSTACLAYYIAEGYTVRALWIDYGQAAASAEESAVEKVTTYYTIPLQKIRTIGIHWPTLGNELFEFRGRNLTFVSLAYNTTPHEPGLIALGIHQGTDFADCTETFTDQVNNLLIFLSDGSIRLNCPFIQWSKLDIARYVRAQHVPIDLTYSCEKGLRPPCKECVKCRDMQAILSDLESESARVDIKLSK